MTKLEQLAASIASIARDKVEIKLCSSSLIGSIAKVIPLLAARSAYCVKKRT